MDNKEKARLAKNEQIAKTIKETKARRSLMDVKCYDLKLDSSKLSARTKEALERSFLEKKWIRNSAIAHNDFTLNFLKSLSNEVQVKMPDGSFETRQLTTLGSQIRQSIIRELQQNLKMLSSAKKKGRKVGRLKYTSEVNSLDLAQYGRTYSLHKNHSNVFHRVKIQGIPGRLKFHGGNQLPEEAEFANAKLLRRPDGYHLRVTTYANKKPKELPQDVYLGIDFGVKNSFTLSNGEIVSVMIEETERLKRLQRKLARQVSNSNGYHKTKQRVAREYQKINNRKADKANKIVSKWCSGSTTVFIQDEMISSWRTRRSKARGGRKVQHSVLGKVKAKLMTQDNVVVLPKWVATTAWCPECGALNPHELKKRTYLCPSCEYTADRDVHSAKNMILLGKKYVELASGTDASAGGGAVRPAKEKLYEISLSRRSPVKPEAVKS